MDHEMPTGWFAALIGVFLAVVLIDVGVVGFYWSQYDLPTPAPTSHVLASR
jgi:hypothetical protein